MTTAIAPHHDHGPDDFEARLREVLSEFDPAPVPTVAHLDALVALHDAHNAVVAAAKRRRLVRIGSLDRAAYLAACAALDVAVDRLVSLEATVRPLCRHESDVRPPAGGPDTNTSQAVSGGRSTEGRNDDE